MATRLLLSVYVVGISLSLSLCILTNSGTSFPRNFITIAKTILKRLFRVYAHIYHAHFDDIISLKEEVSTMYMSCQSSLHLLTPPPIPPPTAPYLLVQAHLNTSFKHFIYFVHEFGLIEKRELSPMQELIDRMMKA